MRVRLQLRCDAEDTRNRLRAILAVVLSANLLDSTITNIAAPSIVRDIGGGESLIKPSLSVHSGQHGNGEYTLPSNLIYSAPGGLRQALGRAL